MEEQYYTVAQLAARMKVTRQAVYNWIDQGKLQAVKVGSSVRIPESSVKAFMRPTGSEGEEKDKG